MCLRTKHSPLAVTMMIGWAVTGAVLVLSGTRPGWGASLVIPPMATWAEELIGGFLLVGSLLSLGPAVRPLWDLSRVWRLDELGMWLAAGGWVTYSVVAAVWMPGAVVHWLVSLTCAASAVVRIVTIRRQRARTESSLARMHGGAA